MKGNTHELNHDLSFSAHTINCVCHSIRSMFRVLGMYNFASMFNLTFFWWIFECKELMGMFCSFYSSFFCFFVFGHFWRQILRNLCLHFARQDGQEEKKQNENHATKIPKIKRQNYGMKERKIKCLGTKNWLIIVKMGPNRKYLLRLYTCPTSTPAYTSKKNRQIVWNQIKSDFWKLFRFAENVW